jgi:hypothetical protein
MSAYKQVSEYFSEDGLKTSMVMKELSTNTYTVQLKNDSGTYFAATFDNIDSAEQYAEDWVLC